MADSCTVVAECFRINPSQQAGTSSADNMGPITMIKYTTKKKEQQEIQVGS